MPAQRDELAAAQACVGGNAQQLRELGVLLGAEQLPRVGQVVVRPTPGTGRGGAGECLDLLDREDLQACRRILAALRNRGGRVGRQSPALSPRPRARGRSAARRFAPK
jgi:hypothetical protein